MSSDLYVSHTCLRTTTTLYYFTVQ